jgi:hypothetical protein
MRRLASSVLLSLLPLACAGNVSEGGSGDQPGEIDEASKPNALAVVTEPEVQGQPPARAPAAELPDCPADANVDDTYCTDDGKLAGRWVPVDTLRPPTSAQTVFEAASPGVEQQPSLIILLDGGTLYIKQVTCGSCRRVIGWGFSGQLDILNDEQLLALQVKLGLGFEAPLLDSADAWRHFTAQDSGKAELTELSKTVR